jgi:hypothetical protein
MILLPKIMRPALDIDILSHCSTIDLFDLK